MIDEVGIESAISQAGGVWKLLNILGDDLSIDVKIELIKYIVRSLNGIYLEAYTNTIFYKEDNFEYHEIFNLLPQSVDISVWDKETLKMDRYSENYEDLDEDIINKILEEVLIIKGRRENP
jgi:hypothetical protein